MRKNQIVNNSLIVLAVLFFCGESRAVSWFKSGAAKKITGASELSFEAQNRELYYREQMASLKGRPAAGNAIELKGGDGIATLTLRPYKDPVLRVFAKERGAAIEIERYQPKSVTDGKTRLKHVAIAQEVTKEGKLNPNVVSLHTIEEVIGVDKSSVLITRNDLYKKNPKTGKGEVDPTFGATRVHVAVRDEKGNLTRQIRADSGRRTATISLIDEEYRPHLGDDAFSNSLKFHLELPDKAKGDIEFISLHPGGRGGTIRTTAGEELGFLMDPQLGETGFNLKVSGATHILDNPDFTIGRNRIGENSADGGAIMEIYAPAAEARGRAAVGRQIVQ